MIPRHRSRTQFSHPRLLRRGNVCRHMSRKLLTSSSFYRETRINSWKKDSYIKIDVRWSWAVFQIVEKQSSKIVVGSKYINQSVLGVFAIFTNLWYVQSRLMVTVFAPILLYLKTVNATSTQTTFLVVFKAFNYNTRVTRTVLIEG